MLVCINFTNKILKPKLINQTKTSFAPGIHKADPAWQYKSLLRTYVIATSSHLPEDQAKSINISLLKAVKVSVVNGLIQHFRSHVSTCADTVVWRDVY